MKEIIQDLLSRPCDGVIVASYLCTCALVVWGLIFMWADYFRHRE